MFKKIFSRFCGKSASDDVKNEEDKIDDPFLYESFGQSEEYNLSSIQDRIELSASLIDERPEEVIRLMKGNCHVLKRMLILSMKTYTSDKLMFILTSTSRMNQCYLKLEKYAEVIAHFEEIEAYRQDALTLYPSNWNILLGCCNLFCQTVIAKFKLQHSCSEEIAEVFEIVNMMKLCFNNISRKYSVSQTLEFTAGVLYGASCFRLAKLFYKCAYDLFTEDELIARRDPIVNLGIYNVCLLNEAGLDLSTCEDSFREEIAMYEMLRTRQGESTCKSLMDLAIAHSHYGQFFLLQGNFIRAVDEHLVKIDLCKQAYGMESVSYTHEHIETLVLNSVQMIVNQAENLPDSLRTDAFQSIVSSLSWFIDNNSSEIHFFVYVNHIAMELFRWYKRSDENLSAMKYLFVKIKHLSILFDKYGTEKGIVDDMLDTYTECLDFLKQNKDIITEEQVYIWIHYFEQMKSCGDKK